MATSTTRSPCVFSKVIARIHVDLDATVREIELAPGVQYRACTFNDYVPGPFIRAREGDTVDGSMSNSDSTGVPHNVDFHAVIGPGSGGAVTTVSPEERRVADFKLVYPPELYREEAVPTPAATSPAPTHADGRRS